MKNNVTKKGNISLASAAVITVLAIASSIYGFFGGDKQQDKVLPSTTVSTEYSSEAHETKQDTTENDTTDTLKEVLEVHFIDVGQGDATLIKCGDHAMLIDAGDNSKGSAVRLYLKKQNVEKLDIVVGTHPDADHIGGLDVIVYNFPCDTIIMPDYSKDTKTYNELIEVINNKNYKITRPVTGSTYMLGEAKVTIIGPVGNDYGDNSNNYSVVLRIDYGGKSFLFTGDAEEEAEEDILKKNLNVSADVYKAAHHGSYTANTYDYLMKVNPSYAVISCGQDNSYGHPHKEVLERLNELGISIYRTDKQGTIVAYTDGSKLWWYDEAYQ